MFPSAHVARHLGGAESRQDERNPAPGSGVPAARLPFGPEQPGRAAVGQGPGVSSDAGIRDPRSSFGLSLGPKDGISMSEGLNLD